MDTFTNKEKQVVLEKIGKGMCNITDAREQSIVDDSLSFNGLVKVWGRHISGYDCELTEKGEVLLKNGGYTQMQSKENRLRKLRGLPEENTLITIESSNMNNEHGGLL